MSVGTREDDLEKVCDLFLSVLQAFGISEKFHFENYTTSIGPEIRRIFRDTLLSAITSKPCYI